MGHSGLSNLCDGGRGEAGFAEFCPIHHLYWSCPMSILVAAGLLVLSTVEAVPLSAQDELAPIVELPAAAIGMESFSRLLPVGNASVVVLGHGRTPVVKLDAGGAIEVALDEAATGGRSGFLRGGSFGDSVWIQRSTTQIAQVYDSTLTSSRRQRSDRALLLADGSAPPFGPAGTVTGPVLSAIGEGGALFFNALVRPTSPVPPAWRRPTGARRAIVATAANGVISGVVYWHPSDAECRAVTLLMHHCQLPVALLAPDAPAVIELSAGVRGADSGMVTVTRHSLDGMSSMVARLPADLVLFSSAERDSLRSRLLSSRSAKDNPAVAAALRERYHPVASAPVQAAFIGGDGRIWIQIAHRGDGNLYWILSPDGELLRRVIVPPDVVLTTATRERAWGFRTGVGPPTVLLGFAL